jgi:small-conductance mechanosensitive channel
MIVALIYFFQSPAGSKYLTGLSLVSAAIVFGLQNYVASLFSFLYIVFSRQYEKGDIIHTGNPFMTVNGKVESIWLFFTRVREVDEEHLFTGSTVSFPNNLILSGGIFNYTKNDLLFRHEFSISLGIINNATSDFAVFKKIIVDTYVELLQDKQYYTTSTIMDTYKPKITMTITDKGLICKVRVMVHFYKIVDSNNILMCKLVDAHQAGTIYLVQDVDFQWLDKRK